MDGDLLVPSDAERSDGVSGLGRDGCLTGQLFEYLGCSGEPVTALSDGNVCRWNDHDLKVSESAIRAPTAVAPDRTVF